MECATYMCFVHISFFLFSDNSLGRMLWPADYSAAASDGEVACADRMKPNMPANPEPSPGSDTRMFPDSQTQDAMTVLLPSMPNIYANPHKGKEL